MCHPSMKVSTGMFFFIHSVDKPGHAEVRARTRPAHLDYMKGCAEKVLVAGPTLADDGQAMTAAVFFPPCQSTIRPDGSDLMVAKRFLGQERREARCGASGERRDAPEGPFCPTEGRVHLRRGVVAPPLPMRKHRHAARAKYLLS